MTLEMTDSSLKQRFLRLLREIMRRNKVRQKDLAKHLSVSASAMSQIMNGLLPPSQKRLDQMFELLKPELQEAEQLQDMLYWLRSGRRHLTLESNRRLFMLRCRCGISLRQLSESTMIPMARLRKLENSANTCISVDEAEALAGALGCSAKELTEGNEYEAQAVAPLEAAEGDRIIVPRIGLAELADCPAGGNVGNHASDLARKFTECESYLDSATVVADASSEELHAAIPGSFSLTLGERRRDDSAGLELCMNTEGEFFVRGGRTGVFGVPGGGSSAVWSVPILKICYFPEN